MVSILVLVDVSPEGSQWLLHVRISSFNPCSRGCFARSWYCAGFRIHVAVSILVLVDVSPEVCQGESCPLTSSCFNPCSRGCFARSAGDRRISLAMRFQSLFSWMFRPKTTATPDQVRVYVSILVLVDVSPEDGCYRC